MPGFENDHMKKGEDVHVKWTATSGNVSSSTYNA
jgi:6-phosphogluconate dehydrogenase